MDLEEAFTHLLENAPCEEIFDILDARRQYKEQQKEDLVKC